MNYDEIFKLIEDIKPISKIDARKLTLLVEKHMDEKDPIKANELEQKTRDILYWFFVRSIDSDSRHKIYDLGCDIAEECSKIAQDAGNGWTINNNGAFRYVKNNGNYVVVNSIPRTYKNGFNPTNDSGAEAINFLARYNDILRIVSRNMDLREETITFTKKAKNKKVSIELLDGIIDYLNLPKVSIMEDESLIKKEFVK